MATHSRFATLFIALTLTAVLLWAWAGGYVSAAWWVLAAALSILGIHDVLQTRHAILRNYPIAGHFRFLFEEIRPEIRQYLIESDTEAVPFSRNQRAIVYHRAKQQLDKRPFGTQIDI